MTNPTPYFGEYLISPIPLELSFNWCTYQCRYCFANLNVPNRKANVKAISRFFATYHERTTLEARLYQAGYATCVSNLVDLFAPSNFLEALPIVRLMHDLGLPLQFQTRGSNNWRWVTELLDSLDRPSVWYVTVTMLDDEVRRQVEPGATKIDMRFRFIEELRRRGHRVVLGFNPAVRDWCPDYQTLIGRAVDSGVEGMWTESLHLNYRQIRNMDERDRAAIGPDLIQRSQRRRLTPEDWAYFIGSRAYATERGLPVFSIGQGVRSAFFDLYHATYPGGTFKTLQDFVNLCYDYDLTNTLIAFEAFSAFFTPAMPKGTLPIDSYLGSVAHNLWRDYHVPPQMTFHQLLSVIWRDIRIKSNPARLPCFAYAARWDDGTSDGQPGWIVYVDEREHPYLVFTSAPAGFTDYYTHVDLPAGGHEAEGKAPPANGVGADALWVPAA